jgi:HlyD family secretion protein
MRGNMKNILYLLLAILIVSCGNDEILPDGYGNFEATEILISAEGTGKIINFEAEEGDKIAKNQILGYIDTVQLQLQKEQIEASIFAVTSKVRDVQVEVNVLTERKNAILKDKARLQRLYADSAATLKQMDDINSQLDILDKQIDATRKGLTTTNSGILAEIKPLQIRLKQIEDQLEKCKIKSPITGTILSKFAEEGEFTIIGKPLFKVAELDNLIMKAYISETQLSQVKIGKDITVNIDSKSSSKSFSGRIMSIAEQAEFTPKIVQTKEERVNLVYAIKIKVPNDGSIKIGMPGEIYFQGK